MSDERTHSDSAPPGRYAFPFPYGWFQVGYSHQLGAGEIKPIHYFDREMALWRDEEGGAHVADAYCPHLGAHFAHGGTVEGCAIRCPYHRWKFDADGEIAEIPYATGSKPKGVRVRTYPVVERNGFVLMWYHPRDAEPEWEIPDVPQYTDPGYLGPFRLEWTIHTCWQEMTENEADLSHFGLVHGEVSPAFMDRFDPDGPFLFVRRLHNLSSPLGVLHANVEQDNHGPGFVVTRFTSQLVQTCLVSGITPIDSEYVHVRFGLKVRRPRRRDRLLARLATRRSMLSQILAAAKQQIDEDILMWENKLYLSRPPLASRTDAFIPRLRRWCQQFYVEDGLAAEVDVPGSVAAFRDRRGAAAGGGRPGMRP